MSTEINRAITAQAPTRIDLAGGTIDIWPLYLFHPGSVTVNAAINLYARVQVTPTDGPGIALSDRNSNKRYAWTPGKAVPRKHAYPLFREALHYFSFTHGLSLQFQHGAPKGAGLAGSSALLVALCGALMKGSNQPIARERFLRLVRDIETRLIQVPAGMQDYYPAIWGGVQALWWQEAGARREALTVSLDELEKWVILVYTGTSRYSGTNNWEIFKQHLDGDRQVRRLLASIAGAARDMVAALERHDFTAVGKTMTQEYQARKKLFPGIATPEMIALETNMRQQGALAVKACGAGGGGCMIVFADPECRNRLENRIREKGFEILPFKFSRKGLSFSGKKRW